MRRGGVARRGPRMVQNPALLVHRRRAYPSSMASRVASCMRNRAFELTHAPPKLVLPSVPDPVYSA